MSVLFCDVQGSIDEFARLLENETLRMTFIENATSKLR